MIKSKKITVHNADNEPDTEAEIIIQNQIKYKPKVSVIIPVYNVESFLRDCLDSVVNQTLQEIEIICVDDGSTDGSLNILKEYAVKDKRFTIIRQKNQYSGIARNAGLTVAKGKYLSILDSDDFFELNMLEKMYDKAITEKADVCLCGAFLYDNLMKENVENKWSLNIYCALPKTSFALEDLPNNPFNLTTPSAWNKIFLRKFVSDKKLRFQNLRSCNDAYFTMVSLGLAHRICVCLEKFVHYRQNLSSSITSHRNETNHSIIDVYIAAKRAIASEKPQLVYFLKQKLFEHIKGEYELCNKKQQHYFRVKAKRLLGEDYNFFAEIFVNRQIKTYYLFNFLPIFSVEEK